MASSGGRLQAREKIWGEQTYHSVVRFTGTVQLKGVPVPDGCVREMVAWVNSPRAMDRCACSSQPTAVPCRRPSL